MNLGAGIFVIAAGAVLAFAVDLPGGVVDVSIVGWIVMLAGAAYLKFDMQLFGPRRRPAPGVTTVVEREPQRIQAIESGPRVIRVVEEEQQKPWYYDDPRV